MKKLTLICDMDEVVADLSDKIRLLVNEDFNKDFPKGFNKNYWWADYGIDRSYFEKLLNEEGMFLNLQPIDGAIEALHKLHEEGYDIHILTYPQKNKYCYTEKVKWIREYLPFIDIETNFHTTGNKGMLAKENRILVDDNINYLNQWLNNGGISIAFNQGWNQSFEGYRAYDWNDVYNIIHLIEKNSSMIDTNKFREYMKGSHHE